MQKAYGVIILLLVLLSTEACTSSEQDATAPLGRESLRPLFPSETVPAGDGGTSSTAVSGATAPDAAASTAVGDPRRRTTGGAGVGSNTEPGTDGGPEAGATGEQPVPASAPGDGDGSPGRGDASVGPSGQPVEPVTEPEPAGGSTQVTAGISSFTDARGDLTPSPLDPPPPYADLTGGKLSRSSTGFELRVRTGGPVATTGPADRTMNIASFFDVNGDGIVDYEVWANLADSGWGASHFDNTAGKASFGTQSGVRIEVATDELVLQFPTGHLGSSTSFRWSLASEWGRYEVISTPAAARDDAPDNDGFARFAG